MILVPSMEQRNEVTGADQRDLKVETAVFKVFPCRNGASEGALELVAAVNIVDRHSAHHISRKRDQAASSGDRVYKSRNEEERQSQIRLWMYSMDIPLVFWRRAEKMPQYRFF